jgi:hypothetical protein
VIKWIDAGRYAVPQGLRHRLVSLAKPATVAPMPVYGGAAAQLESHLGESVHVVGFGDDAKGGAGTKHHGFTKLAAFEKTDTIIAGRDPSGSWLCFSDCERRIGSDEI